MSRDHDVMSFFDPPPRAPSPPPVPGLPAWSGPPTNVLGRLVEDRVVLSRSDSVVVCLDFLRAYPEGFEFRLTARLRDSTPPQHPGMGVVGVPTLIYGGAHRSSAWQAGVAGGQPAVSLGLAQDDGVRLTNLAPVMGISRSPKPPVLVQVGSYFRGGLFAQLYWHWGLPPGDQLGVIIASETWSVPETRVDLDSAAIARAGADAEVLWAADGLVPVVAGPFPANMNWHLYTPEPVPTGRTPTDEDAARRAIEVGFSQLSSTEGGELVNVEDGRALAPTMARVQQMFGGMAASATQTVDRIEFLSESEASVWFSIWLSGSMPFAPSSRGRAVLESGRWKMSRDTFCGIMARAGVPCPQG